MGCTSQISKSFTTKPIGECYPLFPGIPEQTRKRSKWPPDHQDIVNSAKHIGLAKFCELLISDWGGRLQFYLWKPGAYSRILIILGECSARSRTSWGNKELEADQNSLLLGHVKIWKPPEIRSSFSTITKTIKP
ncbi:unnamed protein product [Brassica rapa subsp. narinosa]